MNQPATDSSDAGSGPKLTEAQTRDLTNRLNAALEAKTSTPNEVGLEIEAWALEQDDPNVQAWLWNEHGRPIDNASATGQAPPTAPTRPPETTPFRGQLPPAQADALTRHLETLTAERKLTRAEILTEVERWASDQNDPVVNQWLWNKQAEANGTVRQTGTTTGFALRDHFNTIGARNLSYHQAAHFGVELVHHPDSDRGQVFHTADGDIVFLSETDNTWDVIENGRKGTPIISGEFGRKHEAYIAKDARIHHTAVVADTATIEPGARIGPHATVGEHAHVGTDTNVASYARVEDGAFVGSFASIRDGSRIGPGAVVGTGANVGSTANVGAGARVAQNTRVDAFDNLAANSHVGGSTPNPSKERNSYRPSQVAALVDRMAQLDRD